MRIIKFITVLLLSALIIAGCSNNDNSNEDKETLLVVTSFSVIEDIVKQIGGDLVETHNLVKIGTDPHEFDPLPEDIKAATDADIIMYNGFNLEGDDNGSWIERLAKSINKDVNDFYELMEGAEPLYLEGADGRPDQINPHAFLDPNYGIYMAEKVRDALIENLPEQEQYFTERANEYIGELKEIDELYKEKIAEIPKEDRILITSERAFQYVTHRYGLEEGFIFQIDTEETGTPDQIKSLIEFIKEKQPPVLFVETNVDQRPMETISNETGVEIYAEIFSDELGRPGQEGDSYTKFLRYNIEVIHAGLTSK